MIINLTKHIKVIKPAERAMFPYSYSLFVDDSIKTMIDAGSGGRAYAEIHPEQVSLLLFTHHHFDHINGAVFFNNANIVAGQEELWAYRDEDTFLNSLGFYLWPGLMNRPDDSGWPWTRNLPEDIPTMHGFLPLQIYRPLHDGDFFYLGNTSVQAIHTPGHSPGHYSFFFPDEEILFSGDLDANKSGPWFGYDYCDLDAIVESVNKLIALKPKILVSSHRRPVDAGVEQVLKSYIDVALEKAALIVNYLTEPRTVDEISDQNFLATWPYQGKRTLFHQKMMIIKHLQRLIKHGIVERTPEGKYLAVSPFE